MIGKRIRTGEVFHVIETVIRVNREHRGRAEDVNVTRCDIQAMNQLSLILPEGLLIKLIWCLKPVASQKQIQVKGVFRVRAVINAVENAARRTLVMQYRELGRVKKPARPLEVERDEVPGL